MDKVVAKHALRDAGIPTPDFYAFNQTAFEELGAARALPAIEERLEFPIVVKPAGQGSALGIKFARTAADVPNALVSAFSYDTKVLLERFIDGRDLAVAVLEGPDGPEALPVVEAIPDTDDFYDFEARYVIGATRLRVPRRPAAGSSPRAPRSSRWRPGTTLGCAGFARVDLMLAGDELTVLEANAIPGSDGHVAAAAGRRGGRHRVRRLRGARARPRGRARHSPRLGRMIGVGRRGCIASCRRRRSLPGVTRSRNSLNLSTTSSVSSTSCSNSIADSAITSSAAKIGAPERTASASASDGRESISTSRPFTDNVIDA